MFIHRSCCIPSRKGQAWCKNKRRNRTGDHAWDSKTINTDIGLNKYTYAWVLSRSKNFCPYDRQSFLARHGKIWKWMQRRLKYPYNLRAKRTREPERHPNPKHPPITSGRALIGSVVRSPQILLPPYLMSANLLNGTIGDPFFYKIIAH